MAPADHTLLTLGVDIGTSSSKGVLVDAAGTVLASHSIEHEVSRPAPGQVEMEAGIWWTEFVEISHVLLDGVEPDRIGAVGVSGMGPCVLLTDADGTPLRPAILYGVDTRAVDQIRTMTAELGEAEVLQRCGSVLSTQAVGPKLQWIAEHEPEVFGRARKLFMPASFLAFCLTGEYRLDQQSASQSTPLYDTHSRDWYRPWVERYAGSIELPPLGWATEAAGVITAEAAAATGLPAGIPVTIGTIDAWSEAISVGAHGVGDLMLMYGTTMFMVNTVQDLVTSPQLWGTVGALPDTRNLAAGMATSGAITAWLRDLLDSDYPRLVAAARDAGPGGHGLLMLPYFAGERTPVADPDARGTLIGLTLSHTEGDLYRAALEATAFGVRHNIEAFEAAGGRIDRMVAVGGGTQGDLWTQIVTDVTGRDQVIPTLTVGASYGAAFLAAGLLGAVDIADWNPPRTVQTPDPASHADYTELYRLYLKLYPATVEVAHALAEIQRRPDRTTSQTSTTTASTEEDQQ